MSTTLTNEPLKSTAPVALLYPSSFSKTMPLSTRHAAPRQTLRRHLTQRVASGAVALTTAGDAEGVELSISSSSRRLVAVTLEEVEVEGHACRRLEEAMFMVTLEEVEVEAAAELGSDSWCCCCCQVVLRYVL